MNIKGGKTMERKNVHLLVIEDNSRYLTELLEWLQDFGYTKIETATTSADAEMKLKNPCDVIIADMRMEQDDSGFAILDSVKRLNLSAVVIILTANDTVEDCRRAFRAGAWDYLNKTMTGANVFEVLDQSIQDAITYLKRWGNRPNKEWFEDHQSELEFNYWGQWIAIANQTIIETADTEEELLKRLEERQLRRFTTTIKCIGDLRLIADLITLGESDRLEFKSTLQWDIRQGKENIVLQNSVLKTIAAFLNTEGGTLLIGVEDNGEIFGLDKDIKCLRNGSIDKFELHLVQLIENKIGKRFLPYIKVRFEQIEDKDVCGVYVRKSDRKAFLKSDKGVEFYVRSGNSSRSLTIPDIYEYLV
jgi:CheY-like chemotaxis protein